MYQIDPHKWEEIIAATYDQSGRFDEVTLTPRSGDRGRDVIAVKKGFGSVRLIESVKRHKPGTKTTAEDVQALLGVLLSDPQANKGVVSTTWEFAPLIWENPTSRSTSRTASNWSMARRSSSGSWSTRCRRASRPSERAVNLSGGQSS